MKKLPVIGLVLGAIAAFIAARRKKTPEPSDTSPGEG